MLSFGIYIVTMLGASIALFIAIQKEKMDKKEKKQMLISYSILMVFMTLLFFQVFFNSGVLAGVRQVLMDGNGYVTGQLIYLIYTLTILI
ncbi:hypothetical protein EH196_20245, partial [Bacillus sp. C1-1]